jgi:hypothetical protein
MNVDDRSKSFDLEAYLRGFLGSVVRFGEAAIHGQAASNKQYAGWGVSCIGGRPTNKVLTRR